MPPELPGFYFDPGRNRYFPDPQSRRGRQRVLSTERTDEPVEPKKLKVCPERKVSSTRELLQLREVGCDKTSFQRNILESQGTHPKVWTYGNVVRRADADMEWLQLRMPKEEGEEDMAVLFVGGSDGSLGIWRTEVNGSFSGAEGRGEEASHSGQPETPLLPLIATEETPPYESYARPPLFWKSRDRIILDSPVMTVQRLPNGSDQSQGDACQTENVIVTTLGKEGSWGTLFVLALQPRAVGPYVSMPWQLTTSHTMHGWTIWTSECNPRGQTVAIGTSTGASLLELECSIMRTLLRSSSAVLSQQFDSTGTVLICGFRNGVISTIDTRLPLPRPPSSAPSMRPYSSSTRLTSRGMRHHFVLKDSRLQRPRLRGRGVYERTGSMYCSHSPVMQMSSSVCSMRLLRSDENYLLAGAMDGTLQRWDRRMVRNSVLSYEEHVNSHTSLPLSLDPSETLLFAGGEDSKLRIWSVSSGRLLSTTGKFDSPLSSISWRGLAGKIHGQVKETEEDNTRFRDGHPWGCWFGSQGTISYVHGCG